MPLTSELISEREIIDATNHSQIVDLQADTKMVEVLIDRTNLNDVKAAVGVRLFLSMDGGLSWIPWGSFGTVGGEMVVESQVLTTSSMTVKIPDAKDKTVRKMQGVLTVVGKGTTSLKFNEITNLVGDSI